jgi:N-acetylmuramoyl-L-alanine amidase
VATFLARALRARGATVVLTRHSDDGVGPCVDRRAEILNRAQVDVAIDIHADGGPSWGRGFAILEPVASGTNDAVVPASLRYARVLRREFLRTRMPLSTYDGEHGLQERTDLGGLNLTTVPQLLIECGNMRNASDAELLRSPRFQRAAARAILRAMRDFLLSERRQSEAQSSR